MSSLSSNPFPLRLTPEGCPLPRERVGVPGDGMRGGRGGDRVDTGSDGPRLRLVSGEDAPAAGAGAAAVQRGSVREEAIGEALDPRWVLAVRVSERLEGAVLPAERREALVRLGKVLGLTAFDASLIIAIVQDQARRGHAPSMCPAAGEAQLRMIPRRSAAAARRGRRRRPLVVAGLLVMLLAAELMVLMWVV